MKKYLIALVFFVTCTIARAQTMGFFAMADLVRLSMGQADVLLINTGKFKLNNKEEVNGQILNSYQSIDKNHRVIRDETLITGAYITTYLGDHLHTVTYKSIYTAYVYNLMTQMTQLGYRQTFKGEDNARRLFIYDNALYHVTVIIPHNHSGSSVEIREKEIGIEP